MSEPRNYVCLVTGATRGIGKGIALGMATLGATIYITGRTLKPTRKSVGGSLEETAAEITTKGGKAIPVVVDHSNEDQVEELFRRIKREQRGRLDVLVNNVYAAVSFLVNNTNKAYYEIKDDSPGAVWDLVNNVGLRNHYICSTLATRMMIECREGPDALTNPGLIVNVSSIGGKCYLFNTAYGVGKAALDRMTYDMSMELKKNKVNICIVSLWPGLVRTEELVSAATNYTADQPSLLDVNDVKISESTELSGSAVAALMTESPKKLLSRSGQIVLVSDLAYDYGLREPDGRTPPDYRSLSMALRFAGYKKLACFIPGFIRVPRCIFMPMLGRQIA